MDELNTCRETRELSFTHEPDPYGFNVTSVDHATILFAGPLELTVAA
jgi:hypothetical protein